ncbi:hypothetical protein M885DRAFT_519140 [Pelagophyceae sp. CCMP2097]|nr:hypothetical protein M885DRAFT_519140 [Pelagophyceae sp. CCMP2097]|mmetsp:Transcript_31763/g.111820  ORF Transcript_31763/g.111820 Transcript_31763/m.111820 type:complete len:340 (-) Transcript_31763:70-1089(-)
MADEVKEERALPGGWSAAKEPRAAKSAEGVRKEAPTIGSLPPSKTHENVWDHLDDWTTVGDDAIRDADVGSSSGPAKSALKQRKPTSSSAKASKQRERPDDDGLPEDMLEERLIGCSAVIFGLLLWGLPTLWWLAEPQHALSRFGAAPARSQYLEFLRPLPEAVTADRFLEWECSAALSIASAGRNVSIEVYLDQKLVLGGDAGAQVMPQLTQTSRRSGAKVEPIRITFDLGDVGFGFHNATVAMRSTDGAFDAQLNTTLFLFGAPEQTQLDGDGTDGGADRRFEQLEPRETAGRELPLEPPAGEPLEGRSPPPRDGAARPPPRVEQGSPQPPKFSTHA